MSVTSEILSAKFQVLDLFTKLDESDLDEIEKWISSQSYKKGKSSFHELNKTVHIISVNVV